MAVIGASAVLAWLIFFETVNKLIWENAFVVANPWMFPVICLPFSLVVGLLVKYRHAPTNLDGSMLDSLAGDVSKIDWRRLPIAIVMPLVSLFSGAVIGPEGGIGGIASRLAAMYNEKVGIPVEHRAQLVFSTLASAYNGLIANPLFTGVLGSELIPDPEARNRTLPANLIGGSIGYLIFISFGLSGPRELPAPVADAAAPPRSTSSLVVLVRVCSAWSSRSIAGALFRVSAARLRSVQGPRGRAGAGRPGSSSASSGWSPRSCMFSGETQIQTVVADPAKYGAGLLLVMALVKLALLAVAFKSGFLGGPDVPGRSSPRSASRSRSACSCRGSASMSSSAASWPASSWSCSRRRSWSSC